MKGRRHFTCAINLWLVTAVASVVYVITLPGAGSLFWSGLEEEEVESGFIPEAFASVFSPS